MENMIHWHSYDKKHGIRQYKYQILQGFPPHRLQSRVSRQVYHGLVVVVSVLVIPCARTDILWWVSQIHVSFNLFLHEVSIPMLATNFIMLIL